MTERVLIRRKFASGSRAFSFSERSGLPFRYTEMMYEPDTGVWLHRSESDGKWNRVAMARKPIIPADPQALENTYPGYDFREGAEESFFN